MPWAKGILFLIMAVMTLSSSLRADSEVFSETIAFSGAVSESIVHFGKLLIGGQGTVSDNDMKTSALGSAESNEARFDLAKAKLQRLSPSVQCSNDSMILRIPGLRTPHLLVDRGMELPVPLSEMPVTCGFSLKRARRDVSLVAPYRGCHVSQQGGSYILPLIIMGAPVQMSCPVSPRLPSVSCFSSAMTVSLGVRADDVKVKVYGSWQPLLLICSRCSFTLGTSDGSLVVTAPFTGSCWEVTDTERRLPLMYGDQEVTLSCPLTQPTISPTTPVQDPTDTQQMFLPSPFGRPWWYPPYYPGVSATLPPTTTTTTPPPPPPPPPFQYPIQQHMFPYMYPVPSFDPYLYSKGDPAATLPPTTTTTPPPFQYPIQQHMFPYMYPVPSFDQHFYSKGDPAATLPPTTTTPPPPPPFQYPIQQHMFPYMYPVPSFDPYLYSKGDPAATLPPTTTTTPPPFQYPIQQHMFPYMYPVPSFDPYFYSKGDPAAPPAPQQPQHPWYPKLPLSYGFQSPVEPTTPAPTTPAKTTPAKTTPAKTTTTPPPYQPEQQYQGYPMYPPFYGYEPSESFVPPLGQYPSMLQYPKDPIFGPYRPKSVSSPAQLSSDYKSRR